MNDGDLTMECGLRIQRVLFVLYLIHGKSIFSNGCLDSCQGNTVYHSWDAGVSN